MDLPELRGPRLLLRPPRPEDVADRLTSHAHLAIGIFRPEDRGRGFGTEATRLALTQAFDALGLREVRVRVLAFNAGAIACYRRCGFREVGRESVEIGPDRTVDILMAVTPADFSIACAG